MVKKRTKKNAIAKAKLDGRLGKTKPSDKEAKRLKLKYEKMSAVANKKLSKVKAQHNKAKNAFMKATRNLNNAELTATHESQLANKYAKSAQQAKNVIQAYNEGSKRKRNLQATARRQRLIRAGHTARTVARPFMETYIENVLPHFR